MLLSNIKKDIVIDEDVIKAYTELNLKYKFKLYIEDYFQNNNFKAVYQEIQEKLSDFNYTDVEICDMLVSYLYEEGNQYSKVVLWFYYGELLYQNLLINIKRYGLSDTFVCDNCGKRTSKKSNRQRLCDDCKEKKNKKYKTVICVDCGKEVVADVKNRTIKRCEDCQIEYRRKYIAEKVQQRRRSV